MESTPTPGTEASSAAFRNGQESNDDPFAKSAASVSAKLAEERKHGSREIATIDAKGVGLLDHSPSEADVARWYSERHETWTPPPAASVGRAGLKAATRGLDAKRKIALTTIDALAAEGVSWAVSAAEKAAADNLDMAVKVKAHSFTLTELYHEHDAAVGDLIEPPALTPETRLASLRLLKDWAAAENPRAERRPQASR